MLQVAQRFAGQRNALRYPDVQLGTRSPDSSATNTGGALGPVTADVDHKDVFIAAVFLFEPVVPTESIFGSINADEAYVP